MSRWPRYCGIIAVLLSVSITDGLSVHLSPAQCPECPNPQRDQHWMTDCAVKKRKLEISNFQEFIFVSRDFVNILVYAGDCWQELPSSVSIEIYLATAPGASLRSLASGAAHLA